MDKGIIFNIIRTSLHDGDGIRTVVYFKGCSLNCAWCHNPEGINHKSEIMYYPHKCISCGKCYQICNKCHDENKFTFIRENCTSCGKCNGICPAGAHVLYGKDYTSEEVFDIIKKDKKYYEISGGGVTFSGGECLLQTKFLIEILKICRENKINTAVETALNIKKSSFDELMPLIDTFFCDIKIINNEKHKFYTKHPNDLILSNIFYLSNNHSDVRIRIPLIPGINDSNEDLYETTQFINTCGIGIKGIELLKYNDLASDKYKFIGRDFTLGNTKTQSEEEFEHKNEIFNKYIKSEIRNRNKKGV